MAALEISDLEKAKEQARRERIQYNLPQEEKPPSVLEAEREKHRQRASKFGGEYVEPSRVNRELALEARKERFAKEGFTTGIDVFSQEEAAKRNSRASRFNVTEPQGPKYAPDEEELIKAARAKKFGVEGYDPSASAMMDMDLFEERQEVSRDVPRRPEAIYLYGVDVMSTKDCLQYFGDYGPSFVEWINDSSCVVVFRDEYTTKRALAGVGRPLPKEEMAGESSEGLDPFDPANMPYFWHKGRDFIKNNTPVHLIFRMATIEDKKDFRAPRKTRELWKQPQHQGQQGGPRKARRTGTQQQQQRERTDKDGDIDMGDAGAAGAGGEEGRANRGRRRKQRNADGTQSTVQEEDGDVAMADADAADNGDEGSGQRGQNSKSRRRQQRRAAAKDRREAANYDLWGRGSREPEQQQQQQQQQQGEGEGMQVEGADGGQAKAEGKPVDADVLLRRLVRAKRQKAPAQAPAIPWPGAPGLIHCRPAAAQEGGGPQEGGEPLTQEGQHQGGEQVGQLGQQQEGLAPQLEEPQQQQQQQQQPQQQGGQEPAGQAADAGEMEGQ